MNWSLGISIVSLILSMTSAWWTYTTAVRTQRAFVFIKEFKAYVINDKLEVMPKWQNTGSTPTRGMFNYVNWMFFEGGPVPKDYSFPDLGSDGKPLAVKGEGTPTFIGPKGEQFAQKLTIPLTIVERVRKGEGRIYVWGWTEYDDVFPMTARHITRFCNEIEVTGMDVDATTAEVTAGISFPLLDRLNCIDGDCG